jgi:hypothetical protein
LSCIQEKPDNTGVGDDWAADYGSNSLPQRPVILIR